MLRIPRITSSVYRVVPRRKPNVLVSVRCITVGDVFGKVDVSKLPDIPPVPQPPAPGPSITELLEAKQSILNELGLFSWYTPSSYFRYALESMHMHLDIPWWAALMMTTLALRLLLVKVVVLSQKNVAIQSHHRKELAAFQERMNEAKGEGNNMLMQQILIEQRDFFRAKDIKIGRQIVILMGNASVFMTQFFAVRKMANLPYPGFDKGGTLWFQDLTACDPYYALPLISAVTMFAVLRVGIEAGQSSDTMTPAMKYGMQIGLPLVVLVSSSQFPAALCVYWCTSNIISLAYAGLFRIEPIRKVFGIPKFIPPPKKQEKGIKGAWQDYKKAKAAPPTLEELKKRDQANFKQAGRAKPIERSENQ
ncbi:unnamed protein product [Bursaphelenchus okinawaensis]|uniref:Membrane insertase YidC/Oxa/ALB C-terminal domain-containing protein n=1 Tax=Bursaphelenchus okinawaensis TaxID=465554 RepID=A0A811JR07_9BILA|nr:unnamed protein product [Bursaphelenchus okinawaensis]CAG9078682.1 unnamed protein product [Bursaphelenchus okinawaensis]